MKRWLSAFYADLMGAARISGVDWTGFWVLSERARAGDNK